MITCSSLVRRTLAGSPAVVTLSRAISLPFSSRAIAVSVPGWYFTSHSRYNSLGLAPSWYGRPSSVVFLVNSFLPSDSPFKNNSTLAAFEKVRTGTFPSTSILRSLRVSSVQFQCGKMRTVGFSLALYHSLR